ncbi:hypothetical protein ACHHYP_02164 [Achlya hypogyna]|uniref:Uncharacterized protein n=1 Tax=Achlya hypogyna TaxID=1202772 RepID=A0A1V9ZS78_ACHHY|nr:hypothetical protein ACHHYP_02164 [Achlya hypogyna]
MTSIAAHLKRLRLPSDLRTIAWRLEHPFRWSTIRSLVFHPFNWVVSTLSLFLVLGSVLSHLYFYTLTTLKFGLEDGMSEVDIMIPHSIKHAAATDLTVHEYFQLEIDEEGRTAMAGVDLRLKHAFFNSTASLEIYLAVLYFVSLKPIIATVFFTLGPVLLVGTLVSIVNPNPDDVVALVSFMQNYCDFTLSPEEQAWIAGGQHAVVVLFSLVMTEFSTAVSHDLMRLFCCEWRVVYSEAEGSSSATEVTPLVV